ncbi:MAG: sulfatase-like hydrolase/transferase, partial [Myxococcales bacterium]|nr:sulfatase-like hydrolase/transferase [Myxococcales bacterium]
APDEAVAPSVAPAASQASAPSAADKPLDVLLITMDTTRADALGLYGQERPTTPNLDRFAERGAIFDRAYASQPSTLPSHSTILTGRLPFAHGARANAGYVLSEDNETLAEVFARHGYVTAAEIAAPVIGRRTKIDQGFAHFRDLDSFDSRRKRVYVAEGGGDPRGYELVEREGSDITRRGLEFLRRHTEEPFFLWLHYFDPHAFYAPPAPFNERFSDAPYYSEVHYTDYQVGRVLTELRQLGLLERTLVVITADHGESLGEHRELTHSYFVYDATMHVPLLVVAPGRVPAGVRIASPVRTADIAPTVLDLAGLPPLAGAQGVSLAPLLRGESAARVLDVYGESFEPLSMFGSNALRFLRQGRWKYVHKLEPELFDVEADPGETVNLASEDEGRVAEMRASLEAFVEREHVARDDNRVTLDDETLAQLNALGYVGEGAPRTFEEMADLLQLHDPDPAARIDDMLTYSLVWGDIKSKQYDKAFAAGMNLLDRNPQSLPIVRAVLSSIEGDDKAERSLPILDRAIAIDDQNPGFHVSRGEALIELGREEEGERALRTALELDPCHAPARVVLANHLNARARYREQLELLERGVEACDGEINLRNDLAYLLATAPDDAVRDGTRALDVARAVVRDAEFERPDFLDTLACAFAEVGNFQRAIKHVDRALELLSQRDSPDAMVAPYRAHRAAFERHEKVRAGGGA